MNYIFIFLILISFIISIINGKIDVVVDEMFKASSKAVQISFGLIGIMAFWLGIVNVAKKSGLIDIFANIIKKPLLLLFPDLKNNKSALSNTALNISANALGLTNAATPFGISAMQDMQKQNPDKNYATDSMCMFLAVNTAGFQIVPAVVIAILSANGMKNPSIIILPTLITTTIAFLSAIFFAKVFQKIETRFFKKKGSLNG